MSRTKNRGSAALRWLGALLLLGAATWLWFDRQWVIDTVRVAQYEPSAQVKEISTKATLTDEGRFYFYASQPAVEASKAFNNSCDRKEANSPILGCYSAMRIYIYDVTDERLDGLKEVTAAHEILHAAYDRLSKSEKARLSSLLKTAYSQVKTTELKERMAYYARTEPGEADNELHSILGTEFSDIGSELERYYDRYFSDRQALIKLHNAVQVTFDKLSVEADALVLRVNTLAATINRTTNQYNNDSEQLNQDIQAFNERAGRSGGFTTQSEFTAARAELSARTIQLQRDRATIEQNITTYKRLIAELDSVTAESSSLNRSLDSTLSKPPEL